MGTNRLEAFSDGVLAVIITIMVLELKLPQGADLAALAPLLPTLLGYVLSFVYVGIYWNNHHHMLHATKRVNGRILWANLHLLFWLSLVPLITTWLGEHPGAPVPAAVYGGVLCMAGLGFLVLQRAIVALNGRELDARQGGRDRRERGRVAGPVPARHRAGVLPALDRRADLRGRRRHVGDPRSAHRARGGPGRGVAREGVG